MKMVFAMSLKLPVAQTVRLATTAVKLRMIQESVLFRNLVTHAMEGAFLTQMLMVFAIKTKLLAVKTVLLVITMRQLRMQATAITRKRITIAMTIA